MKFNIGDSVELNSGGPELNVTDVCDCCKLVSVTWKKEEDKTGFAHFHEVMLKPFIKKDKN